MVTVNSESTTNSSDCAAANVKPLCESPDSWNTHTHATSEVRLLALLFFHKRGSLTEVRRIDDCALRLQLRLHNCDCLPEFGLSGENDVSRFICTAGVLHRMVNHVFLY